MYIFHFLLCIDGIKNIGILHKKLNNYDLIDIMFDYISFLMLLF